MSCELTVTPYNNLGPLARQRQLVRGGSEPVPSNAEGHPPRSPERGVSIAVGTEAHPAKRRLRVVVLERSSIAFLKACR